ncbi:hypothetical protein [Nafulsella turpanensis]|uniref:hypothetical protein n=1 Tax=Nafulsella turpanensis TaxID=1265690 RepID=UPI00034B9B22|nr:hypothetical protein [Nafulsella turpanensis]
MVGKQAVSEVYSTINGKVLQDNRDYRFILEWQGESSTLKLPCFFGLKRRLDAIDIEQMLNSPSACHDVEIFSSCGCDRCFVLTIPEILELRNLLNGARVMLELNSIIYERLYRPVLS